MTHTLNIAISIDAHHGATRCSRHSRDEYDGPKQKLIIQEEAKHEVASERHNHQARYAGNKRTPVLERLEDRAFSDSGTQNKHCTGKRELPDGGEGMRRNT